MLKRIINGLNVVQTLLYKTTDHLTHTIQRPPLDESVVTSRNKLQLKSAIPYSGFCREVLICANYTRWHGLAHFNSTVTFNPAIVLGVLQLCILCDQSANI